jgi:3-oxoacyl-[acyl-carrier protein] reductase
MMPPMDLGLTGRVCVVTGAGRGIGLATARMLCAEGAGVLLIGRDEERLGDAVASCEGGEAEALVLDITAENAGDVALAACRERLGEPWALVNNAGTTESRPVDELTDEDWQLQWDLNVMGPMRLMGAFAPVMAGAGDGRIVNVSSSSGKRPSLRNAAYSVGKAAQLSLSRAFADHYAGRGVLVNVVAPGMADTPLWLEEGGLADQVAAASGEPREKVLDDLRGKVPLGRFGSEEEIAAAIVFLCSAQASFVTGSAWSVDGGSFASII